MELVIARKNIKSITRDRTLVFCAFVIEALFLVFKLTSISPIFYVACAVLLAAMLFLNAQEMLLLTIALMPSTLLMKYTNSSSAVLGYCFLAAEIKHFLIGKNRFSFAVPILFLSVSVCISGLLFLDVSLLATYFRFFVCFCFLFNVVSEKTIMTSIKEHGVDYFLFGVTLNILFGVVYYLGKGFSLLDGNFHGVSIDRNYYSAIISVAICFLVFEFASKRKNFFALSSLLLVLVTGGLLSASRTFFVSLIIPAVVFVGAIIKRRDPRVLILLPLVVVIIAAVFHKQIVSFVDMTLARFSFSDVAAANGRTIAWAYYVNETIKTPLSFLFGNSTKLAPYISPIDQWGVGGYSTVQHNTLIEMFSTIGFVGSILLILCFVALFFKMNISFKRKSTFIYFAPLVSLFLCYFFINGLFSDTLSLLIFLSLVFVKTKSEGGVVLDDSCSD